MRESPVFLTSPTCGEERRKRWRDGGGKKGGGGREEKREGRKEGGKKETYGQRNGGRAKRWNEGGEVRENDECMEELITFENLMTFKPALPISSIRESPRSASNERST